MGTYLAGGMPSGALPGETGNVPRKKPAGRTGAGTGSAIPATGRPSAWPRPGGGSVVRRAYDPFLGGRSRAAVCESLNAITRVPERRHRPRVDDHDRHGAADERGPQWLTHCVEWLMHDSHQRFCHDLVMISCRADFRSSAYSTSHSHFFARTLQTVELEPVMNFEGLASVPGLCPPASSTRVTFPRMSRPSWPPP